MSRVRVLVVEDSLSVRRFLCDALEADPGVEVVGEAEDGKAAIELCQRLRPDVVTLDMVLPVMSGLAATEYIMAHVPTPILIVSASLNRGELFKSYEALAAGAVDVLEKPKGDASDEDWKRNFISVVTLVSRIKVITHPRARLRALGQVAQQRPPSHPAPANGASSVVALGASTGGPGALVDVLKSLPPLPDVPILVVLHIDEPFSAAFAEWLDAQTAHRVRYGRQGEALAALRGRVIMAPAGRHMAIVNGAVRLSDGSPRHSCRPSIDVLFESLAAELGSGVVAGLLTGMGRDGAAGLLRIREAGGYTIAQDEATSVVYGMPREAALLGAAERILPLQEIGAAIHALLRSRAEATP